MYTPFIKTPSSRPSAPALEHLNRLHKPFPTAGLHAYHLLKTQILSYYFLNSILQWLPVPLEWSPKGSGRPTASLWSIIWCYAPSCMPNNLQTHHTLSCFTASCSLHCSDPFPPPSYFPTHPWGLSSNITSSVRNFSPSRLDELHDTDTLPHSLLLCTHLPPLKPTSNRMFRDYLPQLH